ncbi:hypothetical protein Tcan_11581 [Toxocara canis]|uniref:Uncharacterized protein n=1 Tax=Toxocara canis TaxID=6265 RepID=A0A0B2VYV1_TOXCA|nr:hypothetical protein Tcan_11581 [Toxocara canis]
MQQWLSERSLISLLLDCVKTKYYSNFTSNRVSRNETFHRSTKVSDTVRGWCGCKVHNFMCWLLASDDQKWWGESAAEL